MRLLTFHLQDSIARLGIRADDCVLDLDHAARIAGQTVTPDMRRLLTGGQSARLP